MWLFVWLVCGGWILLVPGVWLLYRAMHLSTSAGHDGVVVRSFFRTRVLPWSEIRGFEQHGSNSGSKSVTFVRALTIRNEPIRLQAVRNRSGDDLDPLVAGLRSLMAECQGRTTVNR